MNVRIENQNLRFKISEEELSVLLSGNLLEEVVAFPGKNLTVIIDPSASSDEMMPDLALGDHQAHLRLLVSQSQLQGLFQKGRSRSGLQQDKESGLSVMLQVDIRADSRKAGKSL